MMASPIFRSPSARLLQRDYCTTDGTDGVGGGGTLGSGSVIGITNGSALSSVDGVSSLGSLKSNNGSLGIGNEVLHYTFRPSKQIVSIFHSSSLNSQCFSPHST